MVIKKYIESHNQNPKVFVWTASVESIMRKISNVKICQGHYTSINVKLYYKYVISERLNVRLGPSTEHTVISQLKKGDVVLVIGEKDDWYKVRYNNNDYGWIYKTLVADNL